MASNEGVGEGMETKFSPGYASHHHVLHSPLAIVLVKYWKVAPCNAKKVAK